MPLKYNQSEGAQHRDAIFPDTRFRILGTSELEFLVRASNDVHGCDRAVISADRI
jgi:hypothetical protein